MRRRASAESESLRIRARPRGSAFGLYKVSGSRRDRTYSVLLTGVSAARRELRLRGLRAESLGLWQARLDGARTCLGPEAEREAPRSTFAALVGSRASADRQGRLARLLIRWHVTEDLASAERRLLQRWFSSAVDGAVSLVTTYGVDPPKRLALVRDLRRIVEGSCEGGRWTAGGPGAAIAPRGRGSPAGAPGFE